MKVQEIVDKSINEAILKLKKENMISFNKLSPYRKVELLLYNYNNFKEVIKDRQEQIEEIQQVGIRKKSGSIVKFTGDVKGIVSDDYTKAEEQITLIENSIAVTKNCISILDRALKELENEPYFDIIRMKYFEEMSREDIAAFYSVDVSTISRQKNKLIDKLKIKLFSDDVIEMLFL